MKYYSEKTKNRIVPFVPIIEEAARCHRLENDHIKYKQEVLDDCQALYNVRGQLFNMLMACRSKEKIVLDEEDCRVLYDLADKKIEFDYSK